MPNQGTPNQPFNSNPMYGSQQQGQSYQRYQSPNSWNMEVSAPINVKDLDIIKDQLEHEALAYKKWTIYTNQFQDQVLKEMANTVAQHHKQHFDTLQGYLNRQH